MMSSTIHKPTIDFLARMQETCTCDADVDTLMEAIARTFGDLFGHQSDPYGTSDLFIGALREAVEAGIASKQAERA